MPMPKIDLRLSEIPPPKHEARTIYTDLVNLPDPARLGVTVKVFNFDDVTLWMRVDGYATGWTFNTVNLGSLAQGLNMYRNLDNLGYRAKPSSETQENVVIRLRGYADAGYTQLKWTFERLVSVWFINSADYTQDVLNNFDDGTVQGWATAGELNQFGGYPTLGVASDYALSPPYSLKMINRSGAAGETRARIYKSFATPDRAKVFAVLDWRTEEDVAYGAYPRYLKATRDTLALTFLGQYGAGASAIPCGKWMRLVVPLPRNITMEIRVIEHSYTSTVKDIPLWMDDFKIISKA